MDDDTTRRGRKADDPGATGPLWPLPDDVISDDAPPAGDDGLTRSRGASAGSRSGASRGAPLDSSGRAPDQESTTVLSPAGPAGSRGGPPCGGPGAAPVSSRAMAQRTREPQRPDGGRTDHDDPAGDRGDEPAFRYTAALAARIETRWQDRWARERTFDAPIPADAVLQVHQLGETVVMAVPFEFKDVPLSAQAPGRVRFASGPGDQTPWSSERMPGRQSSGSGR